MLQTPQQPQRAQGDAEEPLDPRLEAIALKMRRLSMVSMGIMFLGVFAVLAVILYRSLALPSSGEVAGYPVPLPPGEVRQLILEAFPGARVTGVTLDGASVFVAAQGPQGAAVIEIDRATWQAVSVARFPR